MDRLATVDLNLLLALHHLLEAGSVTGAARRAGTTQPSMSRTLARLRDLFQDALLVPRGRALVPTTTARALAPRVVAALTAMRHVLEPTSRVEPAFDPSAEQLVVRVGTSDYGVVSVLRPALIRLREVAPGIVVRLEPLSVDSIDGLIRGDLDLALGPLIRAEGIEQLVFRPLTREPYVCAMRRGHPAAARALTLARYLALEHVAIGNQRHNISEVQQALDHLGLERRIALVASSFLTAVAMVAASDLVATLPRSLVSTGGSPLVGKPVPLSLPELALHLVWHPRWTTDPRHAWLRGHIAEHVAVGLRARGAHAAATPHR